MLLRLSALLLTFVALAGAGPSHTAYAVGQVWEYHTRPSDKGSLLRIQKIETLPGFEKQGPVYHISVIGVHFDGLPLDGTLQHLPVSRATLDASVTKLSKKKADFPDASAGIAEWHAAHGGVFTIPLAEIIDYVQQTVAKQNPQQ